MTTHVRRRACREVLNVTQQKGMKIIRHFKRAKSPIFIFQQFKKVKRQKSKLKISALGHGRPCLAKTIINWLVLLSKIHVISWGSKTMLLVLIKDVRTHLCTFILRIHAQYAHLFMHIHSASQ